ncbi:cellulose synthase/poly-beta-1,6-N-acetylglucosamine synthase-like glycosyltransferase [Neolewinella xylanilytica]|uniref:Cellulose synthase/poly-beta-1,6-N-acetylglucosamine synthase-like glycosyltransferase n=1 Tax=Neolewinella xylanilytica TaxID=1514080 RepID=A0A2S6I4Z1_9BACT|nr:glycosyltransferase [Neolewinella xylanilytica]PPK86189.1 cellulose synthase/poly-beta-1,6-N-acetylglucosamine synthase-like glycosyltransferase [Neolewinella xylanilytica]
MLNEPVLRSPSKYEQLVIRLLVTVGLLSIVNFCYHFFRSEFIGHPLLYGLLCAVLVYGLVRDLSLWYYYLSIRVPPTPLATKTFTVDVLTTYYPGEPYAMVVNTLEAIQRIRYPHTTYLCDEADDDYLKRVCQRLGVIHVTRQVRVNAKAGNINNALRQATGEICLILDPDHIPAPDFLDYIVPHFENPEIGFVQTVQAYYNKFDSIVAKGSAQQTFHFYGPMMMCMNAYGTVNAIGANCTFRRAALDSIGGHAPGLAEDMHTAMLLYREGWKSVYVPRILAKGLVPSTLTAYFKQQIKWSRGTFDLLFKVYPKIFSRITWRQRLHYFLIPIHYLAGLAYLVGFLIPILSLLLSDVPWTGHFGFFLLIILPVVFSSFVLRFYIQKWLISDDERGFHIVGGVLEIIGWWVFTLGFVYTLFDKKVPYLPTPKDDESTTHISLLIPNLIVAFLSLAAVVYGLQRDWTPFSIIMAGFAVLNAGFMFFSVYLAFGTTNRFRTFRKRFPKIIRTIGRHGKAQLLGALDAMTVTVRALAPVLLVLVCLTAFYSTDRYERQTLETIEPIDPDSMTPTTQLGLFLPTQAQGMTDLASVAERKRRYGYHPEIISSFVAWSGQLDVDRLGEHLAGIDSLGADAMITWEPWVSHFPASDTVDEAKNERRGLYYIASGLYDDYVVEVARQIRAMDRTVYLRFAHEFDNPDYPWSEAGGNTPGNYQAAWRHVWEVFRREGVTNVRWVYNPWRAENMRASYPGDRYVDFLGITALNYGPAYADIPEQTFAELYQPFRDSLRALTNKEVLLAEFGSLGDRRTKASWVTQAAEYIAADCPEVRAVVAFESAFDANQPASAGPGSTGYLDWTGNATYLFHPGYPLGDTPAVQASGTDRRELPEGKIVGVGYSKGSGWISSEYIPARKNIVEDYRGMREVGINTVRITEPGIYARNLLGLAEAFGLGVIYGFWIDDDIDFLSDSLRLREVEASILEQVADHKDRKVILHWNLGNDVLAQLSNHFSQPELAAQRQAYYRWVNRLTESIKREDPVHPVYHALDYRPELRELMEAYPLLAGQADGIGLRIGRFFDARGVEELLTAYGNRLVLADIEVHELNALPRSVWGNYLVLANWQHAWRTHTVTFDGLTDFHGRRTQAFRDWREMGGGAQETNTLPTFRILPQAWVPDPGQAVTFRAVGRKEDQWVHPSAAPSGLELEWSIFRKDAYGNPVLLQILGQGTEITLDFPHDHLRYELRLTVSDGVHSREVRTSLLPQ